MSVIPFNRKPEKTAKDEIIEILGDFDFDKGAVMIYMDSDIEDMEGEFQIITTYKNFGAKETFAAENAANFVRTNAYPVEYEE